jgi:hypothetical protein
MKIGSAFSEQRTDKLVHTCDCGKIIDMLPWCYQRIQKHLQKYRYLQVMVASSAQYCCWASGLVWHTAATNFSFETIPQTWSPPRSSGSQVHTLEPVMNLWRWMSSSFGNAIIVVTKQSSSFARAVSVNSVRPCHHLALLARNQSTREGIRVRWFGSIAKLMWITSSKRCGAAWCIELVNVISQHAYYGYDLRSTSRITSVVSPHQYYCWTWKLEIPTNMTSKSPQPVYMGFWRLAIAQRQEEWPLV